MLRNTIESSGTCWGTHWELDGNTTGTTKKKTSCSHPPQKKIKKNLDTFGACYLTSLGGRMFLPTCALCHFWWGMNYSKANHKRPIHPQLKKYTKMH